MAPRLVVTAPVEQRKAENLFIRKMNFQRRKKLERRLGKTKIKDEDLLQIEDFDSGRLEKLVARIQGGQSKVNTFLSVMCHWYRFLDSRKKDRLTPKQLKRQALAICREYFIVYETLPLWWVDRMKAVVHLKLYAKQYTEKKKEKAFSSPPNLIPTTQQMSTTASSLKNPTTQTEADRCLCPV